MENLLLEAKAPLPVPLLRNSIVADMEEEEDEEKENEESAESALEKVLLTPLENLSNAAHHFCDLLHHLTESTHSQTHHTYTNNGDQQQQQDQELEKEQQIRASLLAQERGLRQHILDIVLERADLFRAAAADHVDNIRRHHPSSVTNNNNQNQHAKHEGSSSEDELQVRRTQRALMGSLAQLLKRAAEAGNDLFGVVGSAEEKEAVAELVFKVLQVDA